MNESGLRLTENEILSAGFRFAGLGSTQSFSRTIGTDSESGNMILFSLWEDRYVYKYKLSQFEACSNVVSGTEVIRGTVNGADELRYLLRLCEEIVTDA